MALPDAVTGPWRAMVDRTGAPAATALAAVMVAVTGVQYLALPAAGVPTGSALHHRLFYFDTGHPGRVWTLATSAFAHGGVLHLLVNLQLVLGLGSLVEPRAGHRRLLAAFAAGVLGALVAGFLLQASLGGTNVYLGASGGAFGLLGGLAGRDPHRRLPTIPPGPAWAVAGLVATASAGVVLAYGVGAFGIAHVPHVGGLLAGVAVGAAAR